MKEDKASDKSGKAIGDLDMRSFGNLIRNWKPHYVLHYTPRYILNRTKLLFYELRHPDHPWLTKQANSILSTLLKPTDVGLEWGSGRSTLWLAQRIKHLTSVEHDESWYEKVSNKLKTANISNVNYLLCKVGYGKPEESSYVRLLDSFSKDSLDFVLVDGKYRDVCANTVLDKICPGGILVIDNANWFLPCDSISPNSIPKSPPPASKAWTCFLDSVKNWRLIWTSSGVTDTAIWFKPAREL